MGEIKQDHRRLGVAIDHANREKDDFYPTPANAVEALLSVEKFDGDVWEPACGDGAISKVFMQAGYNVISSDLVDRGYGETGIDFLMEWKPRAPNIVTNPPFKFIAPFMRQSLALSSGKVAFLMRLACLEGTERAAIYAHSPLARLWVFSRRLKFVRPGWEDSGAGGMLSFAWFVWDKQHEGKPTLGWL